MNMILSTVVWMLCLQCSTTWAQLDCKDRDRKKDVFVDGNAIFECLEVGNGRRDSFVTKCIVNFTSDIEFDYIDAKYLSNLFMKDRAKRRLPAVEQCNNLVAMVSPKKLNQKKITHDSFATMLKLKPNSRVHRREVNGGEIDYREYIGVALEDSVNVPDMDCKGANLVYRITRIESNSWIECDVFRGNEVPKFKKCLLKKLSPFNYAYIELNDLNWLKRQKPFRNIDLQNAVAFCNSLQSDYEKAIGVIGKDRVKEVSIDNVTDSQNGRQVYDITVHDNGRVYYFRETKNPSDVELKCDDTDRNKVYIVRGAVTECQKSDSGQVKQTLTKCIYREDSDQFQYFTALGVNRLRTSYKFQKMAREDMITFCNSLRQINYEYIAPSLILPEKYVLTTTFNDIVNTDKSVTWFRDPDDMWGGGKPQE